MGIGLRVFKLGEDYSGRVRGEPFKVCRIRWYRKLLLSKYYAVLWTSGIIVIAQFYLTGINTRFLDLGHLELFLLKLLTLSLNLTTLRFLRFGLTVQDQASNSRFDINGYG